MNAGIGISYLIDLTLTEEKGVNNNNNDSNNNKMELKMKNRRPTRPMSARNANSMKSDKILLHTSMKLQNKDSLLANLKKSNKKVMQFFKKTNSKNESINEPENDIEDNLVKSK